MTGHGVTFAVGLPGAIAQSGAGVFLMFRPANGVRGVAPDDAVVLAVRRAVLHANETVPAKTILGAYVTSTERGVAVALLWDDRTREVIRPWLKTIAEDLASEGQAGKLNTSGNWAPPTARLHSNTRRFPATFIGFALEEYRPRWPRSNGWMVGVDATRRITQGVQDSIAELPTGESWASLVAARVPIATQEISGFLSACSPMSPAPKAVTHLPVDASAYHRVTLGDVGEFVGQAVVPEASWEALLDAKIDQLLIEPALADTGFIKNASTGALGWTYVDDRQGHRPVRLPVDYQVNRHLWDQRVIDAHGVNLLTDKHLTHAHDLTNWTIDEVAPKRYLVKAKDLEPWYGHPSANADTIRKARTDFGDMILSWDAILANPGPYTVTNPDIVGR